MANSKNSPSIDVLKQLHAWLLHRVMPGQSLAVALSGGVDSMVLLHATAALQDVLQVGALQVVHVNHGLRPDADRWQRFCQESCEALGLRFTAHRVEITPDGEGIEAAARRQRYQALASCDSDWILLGHHRDDQAETVLLNLLRGGGVHGAAAMAEVRGRWLRPLLGVSRDHLLDYAKAAGLSWVEDDSNADTRFRRNYLRAEIMPRLAHHFPSAADNLARAAAAFAEAAQLIDEVARADLGDEPTLPVATLAALSSLRAANLLAYYLRRHGLQIPGRARLNEMLRQMLTAKADREIRFRIGAYDIRRFRGRIHVALPPINVAPRHWLGEPQLAWGDARIQIHGSTGEGIDDSLLRKQGALRFATRHGGERLQLREDRPHRPLKDLWREAGVPPWRRQCLPVLYAGDDVVWVAGIGVTAKYQCKPGADGILIEFDGVTW